MSGFYSSGCFTGSLSFPTNIHNEPVLLSLIPIAAVLSTSCLEFLFPGTLSLPYPLALLSLYLGLLVLSSGLHLFCHYLSFHS